MPRQRRTPRAPQRRRGRALMPLSNRYCVARKLNQGSNLRRPAIQPTARAAALPSTRPSRARLQRNALVDQAPVTLDGESADRERRVAGEQQRSELRQPAKHLPHRRQRSRPLLRHCTQLLRATWSRRVAWRERRWRGAARAGSRSEPYSTTEARNPSCAKRLRRASRVASAPAQLAQALARVWREAAAAAREARASGQAPKCCAALRKRESRACDAPRRERYPGGQTRLNCASYVGQE